MSCSMVMRLLASLGLSRLDNLLKLILKMLRAAGLRQCPKLLGSKRKDTNSYPTVSIDSVLYLLSPHSGITKSSTV